MPAKISVHAREGSRYTISVTFRDEAGGLVIPTALTWTLTDLDGNVINDHDAEAVTPSESTEDIVLGTTAVTIIAGQTNERCFLVEWTYNSTYGTDLTAKEQAVFVIDNLLHIT